MGIPTNPNTIVIKNQFYPNGLKEIDIWNHYQNVKPQLLKETDNRSVMFAIMTDVNKPVMKRKGPSGVLRINHKNYDTLITGRTTTIYSEMSSYESYGIIDIDISPGDGFMWARKAAADVYDFVMDKMPIVRTASVRFTGKSSFHVVCDFNRKMKIDAIRFLLGKFLKESDLSKIYSIESKRRPGVVNLDLSPNKLRGTHITLHSLSVVGLKCMEVPYHKILTFNLRDAILRR